MQHWSLFKHIEFKYGLTQFVSHFFFSLSYCVLLFSHKHSHKKFYIPLLSTETEFNSMISSKMYIFEIGKVLLFQIKHTHFFLLSFSASTFAHHFLIWFKQLQCNQFLPLARMHRVFLSFFFGCCYILKRNKLQRIAQWPKDYVKYHKSISFSFSLCLSVLLSVRPSVWVCERP